MADWQPIETAPLRVELIVFAPNEEPSVFTAQGDSWRADGSKEWHRYCADIRVNEDDFYGDPPVYPTHWMPLPDAPLK